MATFVASSIVPADASAVYAWHARPGAFERLQPPWEHVEIVERSGTIESGRVRLQLRVGPLRFPWLAEHYDGAVGEEFRDRQLEGPFRRWEHLHRFVPLGANCCRMEDRITYELPWPFSFVPGALARSVVESQLRRTFAYRHRVVRGDLSVHGQWSRTSLTFWVTGASGLVGSALCAFLTTGGHALVRMVRREPCGANELRWDPNRDSFGEHSAPAADVVVHLAGANIGSGRWTAERKREILTSRVDATRNLCTALARLERKPEALICASAIGYYGDRGSEALAEDAAPGAGFLSEVCRAWERATQPAEAAGIRVVHLRIGVVLTPAGGALAQMLPLFRFGLGGRVGSGRQYVSWIALDDLLAAILFCAVRRELRGAINAVAPTPVTNAEWTRTLARVLGRPALLPAPAPMLRVALGEMADELLLSSTRVWPRRLLEASFAFQYPELEAALRHVLGATSVPLEEAAGD